MQEVLSRIWLIRILEVSVKEYLYVRRNNFGDEGRYIISNPLVVRDRQGGHRINNKNNSGKAMRMLYCVQENSGVE